MLVSGTSWGRRYPTSELVCDDDTGDVHDGGSSISRIKAVGIVRLSRPSTLQQ